MERDSLNTANLISSLKKLERQNRLLSIIIYTAFAIAILTILFIVFILYPHVTKIPKKNNIVSPEENLNVKMKSYLINSYIKMVGVPMKYFFA